LFFIEGCKRGISIIRQRKIDEGVGRMEKITEVGGKLILVSI
jgi:hypothetical protein